MAHICGDDFQTCKALRLTHRYSCRMHHIALYLVSGLVMVSCWFFAMGAHELQTASDYDLRYRYLRTQGKATATDFAHLDSMFILQRNPKSIHQLEQKVIDYEQALQRQAELLMEQKRIQQEQGELKKHLKK